MDLYTDIHLVSAPYGATPPISSVASERVRALAIRAIEGAPALTAGEMRELANAILEHNALSENEV